MSSPIKPSFKTEWPAWLLIAVAAVVSYYFYQNFPARVPTHWNFRGEVDGYSSSAFGAFFMPVIMAAMYVFFLILPYLDPRRERYSEFAPVYHLVKNLILVFMFILFILTGLAGLGYGVDISFYVPVMIGALFIALGLLMGKVKMNWFMGIRTPWTMSSEAVWIKTHRAAPFTMTVSGLMIAATVFTPSPVAKLTLFILAIAAVAVCLPVYSYILFRKEQTENKQ